MAKKKKIEIIDQELTPTVLAIKQDKKKVSILGVVWIFIIFAIFVGGVIYLPEITNYVNEYLNPSSTSDYISNNSNTPEDDLEDEDTVEIVEYYLSDNPTITTDYFTISSISVLDNSLTFSLTNNTTDILDLDDYNYFISLYDENNTLLDRIMLSDLTLATNETSSLSYSVNSSDISKLTLLEISEDEYPTHIVDVSESGTATLVCTKDYETVNYLLTNNAVYAIQDIFTVSVNDSDFNLLYSTYQALNATYSTIEGVDSSITLENNTLKFQTIINLNTYTDGSIDNKIIYTKGTDAKVMNFELEAMGYDCN